MPATVAYRPDPASAVAIFRERFLVRTDFVCGRAPWGKPCPVSPASAEELDALLFVHVGGRRSPKATARFTWHDSTTHQKKLKIFVGRHRIGSYCPSPSGLAGWTCLDFDGAGHAKALVDPLAAALAAYKAAVRRGLPCYLEQSGSGKGWHVWIFFDSQVPAATARALGLAIAPHDAPLVGGGVAEPVQGHGIEAFPKSSQLKQGGVGHPVWLPWHHGAHGAANLFHRITKRGRVTPYLPDDFTTVGPDQLDMALSALGVDPADPMPGRRAPSHAQNHASRVAPAAMSLEAHRTEDLREVRRRSRSGTTRNDGRSSRRGVLYYAFDGRGWIVREVHPGKWAVRCPWAASHTSPRAQSAVLFGPDTGQEMGHFACAHAHCADRGLHELLAVFGDEELECARALAGVVPSNGACFR